MARPMDLVGKYVVWPNLATLSGGVMAPAHGAMIATTEWTAFSLNVYGAPPAVAGGPPLMPDLTPWAFNFLKYQDGGVTEVRLNTPVLTGAMSGCYTFRYHANGSEHVSHVGSGATPATTLRAKQNWKRYAANCQNIEGVDSFYDADVVAQVMALIPGIAYNRILTYHYYDGGGVYKILLALLNAPSNLWKFMRVEQLNGRSWTMIKLGSKFRGV